MHYWSNVLSVLRNKVGAEVLVTSVPPCVLLSSHYSRFSLTLYMNRTGSIASRSETLHRQLQDRAYGRGVNFLAHSMGGLDCRHLISHIKPTQYAPLSLTTISTPHRGSPFMDWCVVRAMTIFYIILYHFSNSLRVGPYRNRKTTRERITRQAPLHHRQLLDVYCHYHNNTHRSLPSESSNRQTRHPVPSLASPPIIIHHPPPLSRRLPGLREPNHSIPDACVQPTDARRPARALL